MAYSETLAERIRTRLVELPNVEEIHMMGGLCFMYNGKMCVGIMKDDLMCRVDPDVAETLLQRDGCRQMEMSGRTMKGYLLVDETGMRSPKDFNFWIEQCLAYNPKARASKKRQ